MSNFSVSVEPQYPLEDMWKQVRNRARITVGKEGLETPVSDRFKAKMLVSEHSPIRELRFVIHFHGIPTYVAQQFSRHRIAIQDPGDYLYLEERINPTDAEHYVRTQRTDRTGEARGSQEAPVDYDCVVNAQGLIDMSKKRLCLCADPAARAIWIAVKSAMDELEPLLGNILVPSCVYRGGECPEMNTACKWHGSTMYGNVSRGYIKTWTVASTPETRTDR